MNDKLVSLLLTLTLLFSACGSNTNNSTTNGKSSTGIDSNEKEFIYNLFLTEYLWYDQVDANVDFETITTSAEMIDRLRVNPPDRWSFSITEEEYEAFSNQKTEGFGFGYTGNNVIFLVRIDSPAYGKLLRGDTIIQVNGKPMSDSELEKAKNNLNSATTFTVLRNGTETTTSVIPREYNFKVAEGKILKSSGKNIAYLRYDSFSSSSVAEFENAFTLFKQSNVSELVVDLRYNGGGSVSVASALLDNITNQYPGKRQGYLDWNENNKDKNQDFFFAEEVESNDLNMKRVFFLVTENSASASELIISSLKPYLGNSNVITIGSATHGKNVGMAGRVYDKNYYFLVNFEVRNDAGETTSLSGIPATCQVQDDISREMGNTDEALLSSALYFIAHNRCP